MDTDAPGAAMSLAPKVAVALPYVHVVWTDVRNGFADVYLRRSGDGGATFGATDVRLDTDGAGQASSGNPVVSASGSLACVAWDDQRSGQPDVRLSRSTDGGATWSGADVRLDTDAPGAAASWTPSIRVSGANVVVAWEDRRDGAGDVRVNRSTDSGATWLLADLRMDTDAAGAAVSSNAVVAGSGDVVFVGWIDQRAGFHDVYLNASLDGGTTWMAADVRLDTDVPSAGFSNALALGASGQKLRAVWEDARGSPAEIRFTLSDP
jgi:hypothetical protein